MRKRPRQDSPARAEAPAAGHAGDLHGDSGTAAWQRDTGGWLRDVLENTPIILFAIDRDGVFTLSLGRGLEALGLKPGEAVGQSAFELYKGTPQVIGNLKDCFSGKSVRDSVRVGDRVFETLYTPLRDDTDAVVGISGVAWDVTQRVQAEETAKAFQAQLLQAQKIETIGTLAGGIAHDFNNILSPILGYTDIAMELLEPDHPARQDLREVLNAAQRARELVRQILIFARGGDQQKRPVQLHLVVLEALKLIRATLPATIEISQRIATRDDVVMADPAQMHQVIMNLCTNAAYAMRRNGGVLRVELSRQELKANDTARVPGARQGPNVLLTVRDQGEGMDAATVPRIFEPFFTTKPPGDGTGLGLSVVHGIVHSHGGGISVETEPGGGTAFHVYLPAVTASPGEAAPPEERVRPSRGEHVLIVDDETEIVRMLTRMLESRGYRVTGCTLPEAALAAVGADAETFQAVITDQTMPRMTGTDLARRIHEIRADLPVILTTGYGEKVESPTLEDHIADVAAKPFDAITIVSALRRAIDRR